MSSCYIPHLVITHEWEVFVRGMSVSSMLSGQFLVNDEVSLEWTFFPAASVSHRSYRLIGIHAFLLEIKDTQLLSGPLRDLV